jgi:hypothetical protein
VDSSAQSAPANPSSPASVLEWCFFIDVELVGLNSTLAKPVNLSVVLQRPCPAGYYSTTGTNGARRAPRSPG